MNRIITTLLLLLSSQLWASGSLLNNADLTAAYKKVSETYEKVKKQSGTERAEFYYEMNLGESKPCTHCPEYLNLIKEVNKIVDKIPKSQNIAQANEEMIQLDRLKFLYYESVAAVNGNEVCSIFGNMDPLDRSGIKRDKLTLLSEELLELPHVTSLQYYPTPPQTEIRYLYRGEGLQSHIIIEVIAKADKSAVVRYHYYNPDDLPSLGGRVVESDSKFNEFKGSSRLNKDFDLDTKMEVNIDNQITQATLKNNGKDWVQIEGRHVNKSEAAIKAYLPIEVNIPSETGVKLSGGISHEQKENLATDNHHKTDQAELKVTNENNQELRAHLKKSDTKEELIIGTRYKKNLSKNLVMSTEAEQKEVTVDSIKNTNQKVGVAFKDDKGDHEYIHAKLDKGDEIEKIHLSTKHRWTVNDETDLKVTGEASQTTESKLLEKSKSNEMILSLTDKNHEYVTARVVQGDDLDRLIALSSRYTVGDYGSVNATVNRFDSGKESVSVGHQIKTEKNSLQTNIGRDSEKGEFINFKMERKISSTASMVLTVETDRQKETTFMYQLEAKF